MLTSKVVHVRSDDELKEMIERYCQEVITTRRDEEDSGWQVFALVPARTESREQKLAGGFEPVKRTETVTEWKVVLVR